MAFLSSFSARGRRLLSLLMGFSSAPPPAEPAVFRGVSCRRLPLGGYANFLAPDTCPAPAVELCLWGLRCLSCGAWFSALCRALPPAPAVLRSFPCRRLPFGVSAFSGPVCLTYCCAGGVGWAAALPLCSFSYPGWLAEVRWVLHPVTGSSHGGCDCSLCVSVVVPFGSPYFGALLVVPASPPAVLSLCGCCALFTVWFPLP